MTGSREIPWDNLFSKACCDKTRSHGVKLREGRFRLDTRKKFFTVRVVQMLDRVAQRGGRCPIPGTIRGQVGWGSEHPDPVADVPARCRGLG